MKLYKVKFYLPEIYDFCEIALSEDEYNRYREVAEEARRDFLVDFPEDKDNAEAWQQYLEETVSQCDFTIEIYDEFSSQEAKVRWIDLDHPREVEDPDVPDLKQVFIPNGAEKPMCTIPFGKINTYEQ